MKDPTPPIEIEKEDEPEPDYYRSEIYKNSIDLRELVNAIQIATSDPEELKQKMAVAIEKWSQVPNEKIIEALSNFRKQPEFTSYMMRDFNYILRDFILDPKILESLKEDLANVALKIKEKLSLLSHEMIANEELIKQITEYLKDESEEDSAFLKERFDEFLMHLSSFSISMDREILYKILKDLPRDGFFYETSEGIEYMELVFQFGKKEEREPIIYQIEEAIKGGEDDDKFLNHLTRFSGYFTRIEVEQIILNIKNRFFQDLGIDFNDITKGIPIELKHLHDQIQVIREIESVYPKGSLLLSQNYGIRKFYRYYPQTLINQLKNEDQRGPYGILIIAYNDYNEAFSRPSELDDLSESFSQHKFGLRFLEAGSGIDMMRGLSSLNKRFGKENKISFLVLNAHGQEQSFLLGKGKYKQVESSMLDGPGVKKLKSFFVDRPQIILQSCSTGAEGGIAQKIAETYNARVQAPDRVVSSSLRVIFNKDDPEFQVEFSERKALRQYN